MTYAPELSWADKLMMLISSGTVAGYFFEAVPVTILVGIIYAVYRYFKIKKQRIPVSLGSEIVRWLFVCYLTGLCYLLFAPRTVFTELYRYILFGYVDWGAAGSLADSLHFFTFEFNLVPTVFLWLNGEITIGSWVKSMLIGNLLMFIPMGIFLSLIFKKINNRNIFKIAILIPVVVEIVQPVVGRSFDVDDIIMNFLGILIGYFMCLGVKLVIRKN